MQETAKHRDEAKSYIEQLGSFGCFGIVRRFRIRMLFRIHRSELKREVQELCLARIAAKLAGTEERLSRQYVEFTEEDQRWTIPSNVFKKAEDISLLWRNIKLLDAHFTQYDTVLRQQIREVCLAANSLLHNFFTTLRDYAQETRRLDFSERSARLRALIDRTEIFKVGHSCQIGSFQRCHLR